MSGFFYYFTHYVFIQHSAFSDYSFLFSVFVVLLPLSPTVRVEERRLSLVLPAEREFFVFPL